MRLDYTPLSALVNYGSLNEPCKINEGYQAYLGGDNNCPYTEKADRIQWFAGWQWACNDHDDAEQALFDAKFVSLDDFTY